VNGDLRREGADRANDWQGLGLDSVRSKSEAGFGLDLARAVEKAWITLDSKGEVVCHLDSDGWRDSRASRLSFVNETTETYLETYPSYISRSSTQIR
jgi:hypothetical protein